MLPILILTCTVRIDLKKTFLYQISEQERIDSYLKSIKNWLYKTNLSIIIVENSGYNFEELNNEKEIYKHRMEIISFEENKLDETKYLEKNDSKGASEMFSIQYAFFNSKLINPNYFIIKITGRYFIPEFEEYLQNFDLLKYDCLIQNRSHFWKRCEIVGSHYTKFFFIFNIYLLNQDLQYDGYVEEIYHQRTSLFKNIIECKIFPIEETQRGGINLTFNNL